MTVEVWSIGHLCDGLQDQILTFLLGHVVLDSWEYHINLRHSSHINVSHPVGVVHHAIEVRRSRATNSHWLTYAHAANWHTPHLGRVDVWLRICWCRKRLLIIETRRSRFRLILKNDYNRVKDVLPAPACVPRRIQRQSDQPWGCPWIWGKCEIIVSGKMRSNSR